MLFKKKLKLLFYKNIMPIRDEKTYAKMSLEDFIVATERAKKGELKLAAFRAYSLNLSENLFCRRQQFSINREIYTI
jgi:hypothetical protein